MKRKIYDTLVQWKREDAGHTAMLIDGARRVGKSYIAEEFAKAEYQSYILIDFNRVSKEITDLFEHYLNDLDTFFLYLSNPEVLAKTILMLLVKLLLHYSME